MRKRARYRVVSTVSVLCAIVAITTADVRAGNGTNDTTPVHTASDHRTRTELKNQAVEETRRASEEVRPTNLARPAASQGPDILVADLQSILRYGRVGDITAYAVGTNACNIGDERASWIDDTSDHPVIAQNMYRLKNGRFEQIGMSWVKHGFYAVSQSLCGECTDPTDGSALGVGCSDPYSAGLNGDQFNMSLLSDVNASTGYFPYPWTAPDPEPVIGKRLQVRDADIDPDDNPGALFFVQGHYVAFDDAAAGNDENNASYRRVLVSEDVMNVFNVIPTDTTRPGLPAVYAWQEFDPDVELTDIHIPDDGLLILAAKATDLGGGVWQYEYALQNHSSDRSVKSFGVPLPSGTAVQSKGFHDVDYHSGEIYDLTNWTSTVSGGAVTWSTEDYSTNPNANALRFSTLYNFRFTADMPPGSVEVTLGLFKPGVPDTVAATTIGPVPSGACCVDHICISTTIEEECRDQCGIWFSGEDCPAFVCPSVTVSGSILVRDRTGAALDPTAYLPDDSVLITVWEGTCGTTQYWPPPDLESPIVTLRTPEDAVGDLPFEIPNLRSGADYTLGVSAYVDDTGVPLDFKIISFEADSVAPLEIVLTHEDLRKWAGETDDIIYSYGEWTDTDPGWGFAERLAEKAAVQRALDRWSAIGLVSFTEDRRMTTPAVVFYKRDSFVELPGLALQDDRWGHVPGTVEFAADAPWFAPEPGENPPVLEWLVDEATGSAVWTGVNGAEPFEHTALHEIGHTLGLRYPRRWWENEECQPVPGADCMGTTYCDDSACQQWSVMAYSQLGRSLWLGMSDVAAVKRLNSKSLIYTAYSHNVVTLGAEAGSTEQGAISIRNAQGRAAEPTGSSLVDLILADGTGQRVFKTGVEIPGGSYSEEDINGDGDTDDRVVIADALDQGYTVQLLVEPGADPQDTVTLTMELNGVITVLLDNVQIQDLPAEPLGIEVDRTPPELHVSAVPELLEACDGGFVAVHADISVFDDLDPDPNVVLIAVEGAIQPTDGNIVLADFGQDDRDFYVRAACDETCAQIYRVTYEASDAAGNISYTSAIVGHAANDLTKDCNLNSFPDACDIAWGISADTNDNGVPDECVMSIPTVSEWGLVALVLLLLGAGAAVISRRRPLASR